MNTTQETHRPAVFLDRDGVLNEAFVRDGTPVPPQTIEQFVLLPGVVKACARLREAGFLLVVVTNQPDVARGTQTLAQIEAMHSLLCSQVELDAVYMCLHDNADGCDCRKPKPGMVLAAAAEFGIDLRRSALVGDRWRDVECARRAGLPSVFVDRHYEETAGGPADAVVNGIGEAAEWILQNVSGHAAFSRD